MARAKKADDLGPVANSLRLAFQSAAGLSDPGEGDDPAWDAAAARAYVVFDDAGDDGDVCLRWSDFAAMLYHAYRRVAGGGFEEFDKAPRPMRVAWEAVARQAANLFAAGDEAGPKDLDEGHWAGWAKAQLQPAGG